MSTYAKGTSVPVERSAAEIEGTLRRYGADAFSRGWNAEKAIINFQKDGRLIRFVLPLPLETQFTHRLDKRSRPPVRCMNSPDQRRKLWEQACRERWRALALAVKAKLEAVESGISEFEQEFFAYIVDPSSNRTVYELIAPQVRINYESDPQPLLLLDGPRTKGGD